MGNEDQDKLRDEKFAALPQALKSALDDDTLESVSYELAEKFGLADTDDALEDAIRDTLLGLSHPKDFIRRLVSTLQIDSDVATRIAQEVNARVFQPVKDDLKILYNIGGAGENAQTSNTAPVPPKPKPLDAELQENAGLRKQLEAAKAAANVPKPPPLSKALEDALTKRATSVERTASRESGVPTPPAPPPAPRAPQFEPRNDATPAPEPPVPHNLPTTEGDIPMFTGMPSKKDMELPETFPRITPLPRKSTPSVPPPEPPRPPAPWASPRYVPPAPKADSAERIANGEADSLQPTTERRAPQQGTSIPMQPPLRAEKPPQPPFVQPPRQTAPFPPKQTYGAPERTQDTSPRPDADSPDEETLDRDEILKAIENPGNISQTRPARAQGSMQSPPSASYNVDPYREPLE